MASFNKIILAGNLTREPELRYIPNTDKAVCKNALAVSRKYKDKEETMFIDIVVFGKLAEIMDEHLTKGSNILVEGRLTQNTWEQDGQKRTKHEITVESFQMLGGKREKDGDYSGASRPQDSGDINEDDIPF